MRNPLHSNMHRFTFGKYLGILIKIPILDIAKKIIKSDERTNWTFILSFTQLIEIDVVFLSDAPREGQVNCLSEPEKTSLK